MTAGKCRYKTWACSTVGHAPDPPVARTSAGPPSCVARATQPLKMDRFPPRA